MKHAIGIALNVAVIYGLLSGIEVLHDAAFAVALALQIVCWPLLLALCFATPEKIGKIMFSSWYLKLPFTAAFWLALAYSSHPYLLASSVLFYVIAASVAVGSREVQP